MEVTIELTEGEVRNLMDPSCAVEVQLPCSAMIYTRMIDGMPPDHPALLTNCKEQGVWEHSHYPDKQFCNFHKALFEFCCTGGPGEWKPLLPNTVKEIH